MITVSTTGMLVSVEQICGFPKSGSQGHRDRNTHLFKIIADRSERGSIIVTTNLPFSEWTTLFENTAMVAAMIDRLTFQSYVLDMNGESYRLAKTKEARK